MSDAIPGMDIQRMNPVFAEGDAFQEGLYAQNSFAYDGKEYKRTCFETAYQNPHDSRVTGFH